MKKLFIGAMILGLATLAYPQNAKNGLGEVELEGVTVSPLNNDYLHKVKNGNTAPRVLELQTKAAKFDITEFHLFNGRAKAYKITFKRPYGKILATFDGTGKITHSYERFKDIASPELVRNFIFSKYPGWTVESNIYVVSYSHDGDVKKTYKVRIGNGDLQKKLKIDADGNQLLALID